MSQTIKNFCHRYISYYDLMVMVILLIWMGISLSLIAINTLWTHYTSFLQLSVTWMMVSPFIFALLIFANFCREMSPKSSVIVRVMCYLFFLFFVGLVFTTGVQYTPFPPIDHFIYSLDRALGVDSVAILEWVKTNQLKTFLNLFYFFVIIEVVLLPILVGLMGYACQLRRYILAIIIGYFIVGMIYYFFPTTAPASIIQSPLFTEQQHHTYLKYYNVHHHIKLLLSITDGGLIAFPSPHVLFASCCAFVAWGNRYLFTVFLLINAMVCASTVLLGWHYFMDVVGALIVAAFAMWAACRLEAFSQKKQMEWQANS